MSQKLLIKKADGSIREVERLTNVQRLIIESMAIVEKGLEHLNKRANMGNFTKEDAMIFSAYVKAIKDLSSESREQEKESDIKKMSDDEVLELAKKLLLNKESKKNGDS